MKNNGKTASFSWLFFLAFSFLYLIQAAPGLWLNSLTNDEPVEITNGYYALTHGDVAAVHDYSPFATAFSALPLLALSLKTSTVVGDVFDRAHSFLFHWNLDRLSEITLAARLPNLFLGLLLGLLLFGIARKIPWLALIVLVFWAFDPTLLALSGLAKTDMPAVFFFFLAVLLFKKSSETGAGWVRGAAGMVTALAVCSKFSCLVLLPLFVVLEAIESREAFKSKKNRAWRREVIQKWGLGLIGFFLTLSLIYLPASLNSPEHRFPLVYFFEKFQQLLSFDRKPYPVYFCGQGGFENHWTYFPVAFVLKSPLPLLVCLLTTVGLVLIGKLKIPAWQWLPPLFFILALLPVLNEGIRFLAPAFPFIFLIAAQGAGWIWAQKNAFRKKGKYMVVVLLVWQALSVLSQFPRHLSYFNDLVTSERKFFYLADSNLDWSQDHKRLVKVAQLRGWKKVKLAYLGATDPAVYGLSWEPWQEADLKRPQPGVVYAVNASFFQLAPIFYPSTRKIAEGWMIEAIPSGKIADSWYYFETPGERRGEEKGNWLSSVPFLQYRKYAFPLE